MTTISILTATYNREKLLSRLYKSLKDQADLVLEWIIVDDGSQDHTKQTVQNFIEEDIIPIKYVYQTNNGKHYAINRGVNNAKGEYVFIVDSDDALLEGALRFIHKNILSIHDDKSIAGISGRCLTPDGDPIGNFYGQALTVNALDIRYKHQVTGDLAEVFRTEVLKKFPFPQIDGEKFCPEALVWNRIAQSYKILYFNEFTYVRDYQSIGLMSKIVKIRMDSPLASMIHYSELSKYNIPIKEKIKAVINFWRFSFNSSNSFIYKFKQLNQPIGILVLPLGFLMYLIDKFKT